MSKKSRIKKSAKIIKSAVAKQPKSTKRITESQHESIKRAVIKREEDNYDKIYFIPCSGDQGWYEISEHSALIYYFEVIVQMGLSTRFHEDTMSFYTHYKYGLIRTNNPAVIKENLIAQNLFKTERTERDVIVYELKKKYTPKDINNYFNQIHSHRIANASIVKSDNAAPEYYIIVNSLAKNILYACSNKMNEIERTSFAGKTIDYVASLNRIYLEINYLDRIKCTERIIAKWEKIIEITYRTLVELHLMQSLGIWAPEAVIRYSDQIIRARAIAKKEIVKLRKVSEATQKKNTTTPQVATQSKPAKPSANDKKEAK